MTTPEKEAIFTLALMAGFADGVKNDSERTQLKRIAASLPETGAQTADLYQRVLLKQVTMAQVVEPLKSPELRQLAYEMAVCVCDADDVQTDAEKAFLLELRTRLHLDPKQAATFENSATALAVEPLYESTKDHPCRH